MTENAYPKAGAPLLESEWSRIFSRFTGVVSGGVVTADGSGLKVTLGATTGTVRGHGYRDAAVKDLAVVAGEAAARIDTVVLELDYTKTPIIQAKVIKGTPGSGTAPALTQTEVGVYQHPLADVAVPANAVVIAATDVTPRTLSIAGSVPSWSTKGRPVNPAPQQMGYNTTLSRWEWWNGSAWVDLAPTSLDAGAITSGVFDVARLPNLDAGKITTGTFPSARIPNLDAGKITTGVFSTSRIPDLDASQIATGTFSSSRIPNLSASKITSGTISRPVDSSSVHSDGDVTASHDIVAGHWMESQLFQTDAGAQLGSSLVLPSGHVYVPAATPVTSSYVGAWINGDGRLGRSASSRRYKQDIAAMSVDKQAVLAIQVVQFRMKAAVAEFGDAAPIDFGVIAEDLHDLGLTQWVHYNVAGQPESVHYERLVLAVLPVLQDHEERLQALESSS